LDLVDYLKTRQGDFTDRTTVLEVKFKEKFDLFNEMYVDWLWKWFARHGIE